LKKKKGKKMIFDSSTVSLSKKNMVGLQSKINVLKKTFVR